MIKTKSKSIQLPHTNVNLIQSYTAVLRNSDTMIIPQSSVLRSMSITCEHHNLGMCELLLNGSLILSIDAFNKSTAYCQYMINLCVGDIIEVRSSHGVSIVSYIIYDLDYIAYWDTFEKLGLK